VSNSTITAAGAALIAQKIANNQTLNVDKFIFADIPGLDADVAPSVNTVLPAAGNIMMQCDVQQCGLNGADTIVYSKILNAEIGDFYINWIGLYSSAENVLVAVCHVPRHLKFATSGLRIGNILCKNFALQINNVSDLTGITVNAETWQWDLDGLYAAYDHNHDDRYEPLGSVATHNSSASPHPGKFEPAGSVSTHNSSASPHPGKFEPAGSVADHVAADNPHPQYAKGLAADMSVTFGISGKPSVLVSAITADGTTASATLTGTHGFEAGDYVNIGNTVNFNGTFLLTEVFTSTIRWATTTTATETGLATTWARYKQAVTSAQIQAAIDATIRNVNGCVPALNFNDGYYYQDATIVIRKFYGGKVRLAALTTTNNKAVLFGGALTGASGVVAIQDCPATVELSRINIRNTAVNTATDYCYGLTITNANRVYLFYASVALPNAVTSPGTSRGISIDNSNLLLSGVNLEGGAYGIYALNSAIKNYNPANTGTRPATGVYVYASSLDGAVITGTTVHTAGQAVYTPLPGYVASRAASGYQKLPQDGNGGATIEQWGVVSATLVEDGSTLGTAVTVTLPIAFPNACINVTGNLKAATAGGGCIAINTYANSNSEITVVFDRDSSSAPTGLQYAYWRAIGY